KLEEEMPVILSIGAIEEMTFDAALDFISPKGVDEEGTVKFTIQSSFENPDSVILRAGYSANAEIVLDKRENVLAISEGNITFSGDSIYVEVETEEQIFEKRMIEIGLSDGMMVEVLSGIDSTDRIKIPHSGTDY
ncbi:MAG: efflux RND transporter periplasmic adaptor subunit, partial [Chitinophagales bacterium]